jgi:hypothetical protein
MADEMKARGEFEALPCPFCGSARLAVHPDYAVECCACKAIGPGMAPEPWNTRSLPAAAALLRANGWRVEEPELKCADCNSVRMAHCSDPIHCGGMKPTCNGTGARAEG